MRDSCKKQAAVTRAAASGVATSATVAANLKVGVCTRVSAARTRGIGIQACCGCPAAGTEQPRAALEPVQADSESVEQAAAAAEAALAAQMALIVGLEADLHTLQCQKVEPGA